MGSAAITSLPCTLVDISLGGAMCRLNDRDDEPAANSVAQLRLRLPGQSEPVIIIARVARVIAPGLLGIAFIDATKRDRSRVATWCQQQVLKAFAPRCLARLSSAARRNSAYAAWTGWQAPDARESATSCGSTDLPEAKGCGRALRLRDRPAIQQGCVRKS